MNATRQVLLGSVMLTFFSIFAGGIAYLTKIVLVRNLTVEEYGLFFSVLTLVLFLQLFISLGLPTGLARTIAKFRVHEELGRVKSIIVGSFVIQMSMALLVMVVLFFLSYFLAQRYFENPQARWVLLALLLYFPLNVLRSQMSALFNGFSKSLYLSLIQFLYNLGIFLIVVLGFYVFLYDGIEVPIVGYLGAFFLVFLVLGVVLFKTFNVFRVRSEEFKRSNTELIIFSAPLLFTAIGGVFLSYFDTLMLTFYKGLVEVGVYNIVYPTALLLVLIGSSIGLALLPVITRLFEEGKKDLLKSAFSKIYVFVGFIVIPAIVMLVLLSEFIILIFFGEEYLLGFVVFNILAIGSLFKVFFAIQNQALIGIGKSTSIFWVFIIGAVSNVVLNILLIPQYSLTGAGIATIVSFALMFGISFMMLRREIEIHFPIFKIIALVVCSLSIVLSVEVFWMLDFNRYVLTALGLGVGGVLYVALVIVFRIITLQDVLNLVGVDGMNLLKKIKLNR